MTRIAIIGAGASGAPATKACLEEGLTPIVFGKTQEGASQLASTA